ncbi:hypothetical protein H1O16_gp188 [Burkholderia phage BcepSaruman]|uniref:Uncharacterized protein n=1 Tax=Burkholderia phage BcepSaruman TaxID=2530032 RepID=A0A4D5ZCR2_9CAUD|nr:hypothetical protein H1O16_gp188 [Burkholderia phage BcepSaruman]QBX06601.1 hypothetical protein BcepSaruman_188 [Burkholderia phage BcepSaruman]
MGIKRLSLSDLDAQPIGPVWCVNSAASSKYELTGNVVLDIPQANGSKSDPLVIRQTWLPMDAAARFGRKRVLESTQFRTAVINGLITLIDEATAARMMNQEGAVEEERRLLNADKHVKDQGAPKSINQSALEIRGEDNTILTDDVEVFGADDGYSTVNVAKAAQAGLELDENGLKASFSMWADRLRNETDIGALNAIRARAKFSRREVRYLAKILQDKPKTSAQLQARIARYAEKDAAKGK